MNMFGILSIPLLIIFLPISEPKALDPSSILALARSEAIPLPICACFFRLAFIFLNAGAARLSKILLLFRLGPIVLFLFTLMLVGSYFSLILSHFHVKDLPFGKFTTFGYALFLKMTVSFISLIFYYVCRTLLFF